MIKFILLAEKEILVDGMTHQRSICPQPSTIGAQKDSKWRADFLKKLDISGSPEALNLLRKQPLVPPFV